MGRQASHGTLEPMDIQRLGNRLHAIFPTDLNYRAPKVKAYNGQGNEASLEDAVDLLDEAHDIALLRLAKYQQVLRWYHS